MGRLLNVTRGAAALWAAAAFSWATPSAAQSTGPNPGAITLTANVDFVNADGKNQAIYSIGIGFSY